jgi:putative pre-16S rRNA nuclease
MMAAGGPHGSTRNLLPTDGPLLAIDWGERRIGLALSDRTQTIATPLATLTRRLGRRFPLRLLREHLEDHHPVGVVLGLPLEADGSEGEPVRRVRELGATIADKTGLPVTYVDERLTTAQVLSSIRHTEGRPAPKSTDVDALAATLILQRYLDSDVRRSTNPHTPLT